MQKKKKQAPRRRLPYIIIAGISAVMLGLFGLAFFFVGGQQCDDLYSLPPVVELADELALNDLHHITATTCTAYRSQMVFNINPDDLNTFLEVTPFTWDDLEQLEQGTDVRSTIFTYTTIVPSSYTYAANEYEEIIVNMSYPDIWRVHYTVGNR